jgi:hypothetical protein
MYCSLPPDLRKTMIISNNAGSFVCNNLAFQAAWFERDINFGFMHVPSHTCRNLRTKNDKIVDMLITMINRGVEASLEAPHRPVLPVTKPELERARQSALRDPCLSEFYKSARAYGEKSWWNIFGENARMN